MTSIFLKMEDNLIFFDNEWRPQIFGKGRHPQIFKMEDKFIYFLNGRRPSFYKFKRKTTSISLGMDDDLKFKKNIFKKYATAQHSIYFQAIWPTHQPKVNWHNLMWHYSKFTYFIDQYHTSQSNRPTQTFKAILTHIRTLWTTSGQPDQQKEMTHFQKLMNINFIWLWRDSKLTQFNQGLVTFSN